MNFVLDQRDDGNAQEHYHGHGEGDDDVAGEGESVGHHADEIADQDEHEHGEDKREIGPAFGAHGVFDQVGNENVGEFDHRLPSPRHYGRAAHAENQKDADGDNRQQHEGGGIS